MLSHNIYFLPCIIKNNIINNQLPELISPADKNMRKIASFTINHDLLQKGMYISPRRPCLLTNEALCQGVALW